MSVRERRQLRVLQYNVQHSKDRVLIDLLADERAREMDVLAIQEPWTNTRDNRRGYNPSSSPFRLVSTATKDTRAAIYINKKIYTEDFEVTATQDTLVTVNLKVRIGGGERKIALHSVYSKPPGSVSTSRVP